MQKSGIQPVEVLYLAQQVEALRLKHLHLHIAVDIVIHKIGAVEFAHQTFCPISRFVSVAQFRFDGERLAVERRSGSGELRFVQPRFVDFCFNNFAIFQQTCFFQLHRIGSREIERYFRRVGREKIIINHQAVGFKRFRFVVEHRQIFRNQIQRVGNIAHREEVIDINNKEQTVVRAFVTGHFIGNVHAVFYFDGAVGHDVIKAITTVALHRRRVFPFRLHHFQLTVEDIKSKQQQQPHCRHVNEQTLDRQIPRTEFFLVGIAQQLVHKDNVKGINQRRHKAERQFAHARLARQGSDNQTQRQQERREYGGEIFGA